MTVLSYGFAFVAMISVLIFVHEFGHFAVAKLCGVRVLKFSLGFGPAIGFGRFRLSWTRRGTEYVVAWFPLGGFVKMLGEHPEHEEASEIPADPSESLDAKPTWQKLAIVLAGPAMNLALPVLIFAIVLAIGRPWPVAVVGTVEPASPATAADLLPGDRVVAVDGSPVKWWDDVARRVRSHPIGEMTLAVERGGEAFPVRLRVETRPQFDELGAVTPAGWIGIAHSRLRAMVGVPDAGSPAARADLRSGDRIVSVSGQTVEDWHALSVSYAGIPLGEIALGVERGDEEQPERLEIAVPALGSLERLGVLPATVLVSQVTPDSPAARAGIEPGDLLLSVDGDPVGSFSSFAEIVRSSGGRTLRLTYARAGQARAIAIAPELSETDIGFGVREPRYLIGISATPASQLGVMGFDQERNPMVSVPRALMMTIKITRTFLSGLKKLVSGEMSRKQIAGPIGIAELAGRSLERGWETYLTTMILISINLGILNLLPIPIFDGGNALLYAVEGIKRSPLSMRTREIVQTIGFTFIVLLMGLAFWNDISRHWSTLVEWVNRAAGL